MSEAKKKVIIIGTGGTISGKGEAGKTTGYKAGSMAVEDIIASVPGIGELAELDSIQVCNVASDNITAKDLISIACRINELAKDPHVAGFVVTHGTDTMDETSFFLNLTVKTEKPVIITGAMRPATAIFADGPLNLYQSVQVAADPSSCGRGVMVVFADRIYCGRDVQKRSTYTVTALDETEGGLLGTIRGSEINWYYASTRPHTVNSRFDVTGMTDLPKVNVLYFHIDTPVSVAEKLAEGAEGLVVAGAGAGGTSFELAQKMGSLDIPVVVSSRIHSGIVTDAFKRFGTVSANNLPPQKAAMLLRLALTQTRDIEELRKIYREY